MSDAVVCEGIVKSFTGGGVTTPVLRGIDLSVATGAMTFLMGESGSGKTTLLSVVAGILTPTRGRVRLFGQNVYSLSDAARAALRLRRIGFVFQQYNLLPTLTAAENAGLPLVAAGAGRADAMRAGAAMLDRLGIGEQAARLPGQLSGGQQQRVAIGRALVHAPGLLVCDEPTAALDAATGRRVMELLREVALADDRAVIVVTHDTRVLDFADRIVTLEDGRIVGDGSATETRKMPS